MESTNYELLIMQLSPAFCHLILLRYDILFSILFSNTLNLCSSLYLRDQVSHPYKTTGKMTVLYILIFTFLASRQEGGRF
jgi:phosphate starvation-inducible membrane PsiE